LLTVLANEKEKDVYPYILSGLLAWECFFKSYKFSRL